MALLCWHQSALKQKASNLLAHKVKQQKLKRGIYIAITGVEKEDVYGMRGVGN